MEQYAHEAVVVLGHGCGVSGPGTAVTVALCGHWEHEGPCAWPHSTAVTGRDRDLVSLRVSFSCEPGDEPHVRGLVSKALHDGAVVGQHGTETWTLVSGDLPLRTQLPEQRPSRLGAAGYVASS